MIDLKRDERVQGHLLAPARFSSGQVEPICARMCNKLSTSNNFKSISVYLFVISGVLAANVSQSAGMTIRQAPSQLFLAHLNQETPTISRVAGLHPKRADEEADGFIMKAEPGSVNQPDQTTTIVNDDTTTTMIPESDRSIPIDTNRQQFVTHDQLNLLNATTRDEYINLTGGNQSIDFSPPNRDNRAQTSRTSGMSKVSHVSNIISVPIIRQVRPNLTETQFDKSSDWLASYAPKPRTQTAESSSSSTVNANQQRNQQHHNQATQTQTTPATTTTPTTNSKPQQQQVTPNSCPGVCRNIFSASLLCRNEINAPCPLLFKCCDKNIVSFNGTPVETSAPLYSPDSDSNTAPLPGNMPQAQGSSTTKLAENQPEATPVPIGETVPASSPSATAETSSGPQSAAARAGTNSGASSSGSMVSQAGDYLSPDRGTTGEQSATQTSGPADQLEEQQSGQIGIQQDRSIYFLSSSNGSRVTDNKEQPSTNEQQQGQAVASLASNQQPDEHQQQQSKSARPPNNGASQSFDSPIATTTSKPVNYQPVVLQTINGSFVHNPGKRLSYVNLSDYRLAMAQQSRAGGGGQQTIYYSNIDPAKKFVGVQPVPSVVTVAPTTSSPKTSPPGTTTDLIPATTTTSKVAILCAGLCMPEKHRRFCLAAQNGEKASCERQDEFCCLNQTELIRQRINSVDSGAKTNSEQRVINDQHSSSSSPSSLAKSRSTPASQASGQPEDPSPTTGTPIEPDTTTYSSNEQVGSQNVDTSNPVSGMGSVLVDLIESLFSQSSVQPNTETQTDQRSTSNLDSGQATDQLVTYASPETQLQQNDRRRLGLDLSFKQQPQNDFSYQNSDNNSYPTNSQASDLITSDGASESGNLPQLSSSESVKCLQPNYCVLHMFEFLCDSTFLSSDCSSSSKCCVTKLQTQGRPPGESDNNDDLSQQIATKHQNQQTASSFCRGSCLAVYHSSLCMKPNELQPDSPGCLPNQVCCSQPSSLPVGTNNLEDLEDSRPTLSDPSIVKDSALMASLLPAPPPSLQPPVANGDLQDQLMSASGRQRQTVSFNEPDINSFQQMYQQQPTTQRPSPSRTSQGASGLINQLYQMFKSSSSSSSLSNTGKTQRQRPQLPSRSQPTMQSQHFVSQVYDPYQLQAQAMQQSPVTQTMQASGQQLMFSGSRPQTYHSISQYPPHQQQLDVIQMDQKYQPNRNRFTQNLDNQQQALYIQNQQFASQAQPGQNYQPIMQNQLQPMRQAASYQNPQQVLAPHSYHEQPIPGGFQSSSSLSQERPMNLEANKQQVQFQQASYNLVVDSTLQNNNQAPFSHHQQQPKPKVQLPMTFGVTDTNMQQRPSQSSTSNGKLDSSSPQRQLSGQKFGQDQPTRSVFDYNSNNNSNNGANSNGNGQQFVVGHQQRPQLANQAARQSNSVTRTNLADTRQQQVGSEVSSQLQPTNQAGRPVAIQSGGQQRVAVPMPANKQLQQQPQVQHFQGTNRLPDQQQQQMLHQTQRVDPNRQRQGVNYAPNRSQIDINNNSPIHKVPPLSEQQYTLQNTGAIVSPTPSNVNSMISKGPFVDLQRFEATNQAASKPTIVANRQQTFVATTKQPPILQDLGSLSSDHVAPCPSSCLPANFNCQQPSYIDDSYTCPSPGSVCCMKPLHIKSVDLVRPTTHKVDPLRLQPTSTPVMVVNSNKLDASGIGDQDEQADDPPRGKPNVEQPANSASELTLVASSQTDEQVAPTAPARNRVLATQCGVPGTRRRSTSGQAKGRVMGGFDSKPGYWCWQAALMNIKNEYLCGGALIGTKWVLTAAHCITQHLRNESPLFVRLGQHNLNSTQSNSQAKTIQVKTSYVHHNHNGITLDNDIALLRLDESVDLEEPSICLVCLPEKSSQLEAGKRCTVTGYGFENEAGPATLRIRQTDLPIVTDQECQNKTSAVLGKPFSLPASSFCAGGELGQDACHGDGGSPLSCLVDDYYELTGIVSWGYKCGNKDLPGLYSKVSTFVAWINQIVSVNN